MVILLVGGGGPIAEAIITAAKSAGHETVATRSRDLDIRDAKAVDAYADTVAPDAIILNAAVTHLDMLAAIDDVTIDNVIDTNLKGAIHVARAFLPSFVTAKKGAFVFVSSIAAHGLAGSAIYAATKAALTGLSASIAQEYGERGIRSNVAELGLIDAGMSASPTTRDAFIARSPLRRAGTPEEAARAILFLASDAASYITGQVLPVH